ncbi:MAG TPA: S41 family peptidase [Pyrinomonadaceae bacterium]|nr:S41 family peptidase [Pyrinomonadaceae bacterium]
MNQSIKYRRQLPLIACLAILTIALVFAFPPTAGSDSSRKPSRILSTATVEGRLAVFDDVWQTINDRYYDPEFHGINWQAQRDVFRPKAAVAANGEQLYSLLRQLISQLHDVHTRVHGPDEKFNWWSPRFVSVGLAVRNIDNQPTVIRVDEGSQPDRAGVEPGDIIERVDGIRALTVIEDRILSQQPAALRASTRLRAFSALLEGSPKTEVEVHWRTKTGELRSGRFQRALLRRQLGMRARMKNRTLIVQLDAFTPKLAIEFTRMLKSRIKSARGIVLDLRENGGGEAEAMAEVASAFLGGGLEIGTFTDRWGTSFTIKTRARSLLAPETLPHTTLPLVVLTSERTSSAAEIFVSSMRTANRAKILGGETCGCVLAIRHQHELPDGGVLDVSELDFRTSQGIRLEQNGITPDEAVGIQRRDLYANRDSVLQLAIKRLTDNPR